jgi:hypothetical protein
MLEEHTASVFRGEEEAKQEINNKQLATIQYI